MANISASTITSGKLDPARLPAGAGAVTSIVGISGTKAEFDVACSDGNFAYIAGSDTQIMFNDGGALGGDSSLVWDKTPNTLNISGSTSSTKGHVTVNQSQTVPAILITGTGTDSVGDTADGFTFYLTHNAAGNRQLVIGPSDNYNNALRAVFRFAFSTGIAALDGIAGDGGFARPINIGGNDQGVAVNNAALAYNATLPGVLAVYPAASQVGVNINLGSSGSADLQRWSNNSGTAQSVITSVGNAGIRRTTATAYLHLGAGTATANTAPLKLTSGTVNTTPEDGAIEFDGTHFYGSVGSTRYQLDQQSGGSGLTQPQVMARGVFGGPF